jgi:hypothetical protein
MFMDENHYDDFTDFPGIKDKSNDCICPKCKGFGGWNLILNAYPLHGKPDTKENRHLYTAYKAICGQCNGFGWVSKDNMKCIHEWAFSHQDVYDRVVKCIYCNKKQVTQDSSG